MAVSFASVTPPNMELTPMRVTFGGVDLGGTLSNVVVSPEFAKADIKADQFGSTILNKKVSGLNVTVVTELAETKLKDNWKVVWPNANLITSGGNKSIQFVSKVGEDDLSLAKQLKLHPLSLPDADLSGDFLFYQAVADGKSSITFSPSAQAKIKVTWHIYIDTSVQPGRFFLHGDPGIGIVAASAGSPVAGANVGNGTITSVAVYNGVTKTETITVSCVGQTSGNNFDVSGSLSGPLGSIHIASPNLSTANFVSGPISFTLNQGSVQFANGDSFTIATVASNYA